MKLSDLVKAILFTLYISPLDLHAMATFGAHPAITEEAAKYSMWSPSAIELLKAAVVYPDREFNTTAGNKEYLPEAHFDRYKSETVATAFKKGIDMYRKNLEQAAIYTNKGDFTGGLVYLGTALHAAEDFMSHSNYIELPMSKRLKIDGIFFDGKPVSDMPTGLQLTQYDPDMPVPGVPEGSDYPHDAKSKDYPFFGDVSKRYFANEDATGYQLAYDSAVRYARRTLNMFMRSVGERRYLQISHLELWNVFPPYPVNCTVGDIGKVAHGTGMDAEVNVVCDGKPKYQHPPMVGD